MENLFVLLLLASLVSFLLSWIIPNPFMRLFKNKLSKGKMRLVLGLSIPFFFIAFGITTDIKEDGSSIEKTEIVKSEEDVKVDEIKVEEFKTENNQQNMQEEVKEELVIKIIQPEENANLKIDKVQIDGIVSPADAKITLAEDKRIIKVDSLGNFSILVNLNEGENKFILIAEKGEGKTEKTLKIKRSLTVEEFNKKFKTESKSVSYKELFRNINDYKNTKIYFTAKVNQVIGDGNFTSTLKAYMTRGSYDIWYDEVLITILDIEAPKILESDVIKIWGVVEGETSYQTVLGATRTVPNINAEIIELVK